MPSPNDIWNLTPLGALLGVVVLNFISIIRGWLIPRASHLRELEQERTRANEWKETALSEREVNKELLKQIGQLVASGESHPPSPESPIRQSGHWADA